MRPFGRVGRGCCVGYKAVAHHRDIILWSSRMVAIHSPLFAFGIRLMKAVASFPKCSGIWENTGGRVTNRESVSWWALVFPSFSEVAPKDRHFQLSSSQSAAGRDYPENCSLLFFSIGSASDGFNPSLQNSCNSCPIDILTWTVP